MSLLIGKRVRDLTESHCMVLAVDEKWALVQCLETAKCDWRRIAELTALEPIHPAGLRPVAYRWPDKTSPFLHGWLISLTATDDQTIALVETAEGNAVVTDFYNIQFMDRGQALPAADSTHPAWLI